MYHKHLTRGLAQLPLNPPVSTDEVLLHLSLCLSANGASISDWRAVVSDPSPSSPGAGKVLAVRTGRWVIPAFQISRRGKVRTRLTVYVAHIFLNHGKCWKFKMRACKPSVRFSRSACPALGDPMDCGTPNLFHPILVLLFGFSMYAVLLDAIIHQFQEYME